MIESFVSERHAIKTDGTKTTTNVENHLGMKTYDSVFEESKAPLARGDHVLALPYWSKQYKLSKTDNPTFLTKIVGKVYTSRSTTRDATIHDWPWPEKPVYGSVSNYVVKADWLFNATQFVQHPTLAPAKGTSAEWEMLVRLADTKALGNVRKGLINLPLLMAERKETLMMLSGKVQTLVKGIHAVQTRSLAEFKRTRPRNRRAVAQRIAGEHLEFVFGMLPLIAEAEGFIDLIEKDRLDFIRSRGVQVLLREKAISYPVMPCTYPNGSAFFGGRNAFGSMFSSGTTRAMIAVRTALRYKLTSRLIGDAYAIGFEPIGTAYDLVPLSFISGWVSNFDYWVRTLSPEFGIEFHTGSRNRRTVSSFEVVGRHHPGNIGKQYGEVADTFVSGYIRTDDREVLSQAPIASLHWDVEVGLFEVTAGISLTVQRYLKPLKLLFKQKQFRYKGPRPKWLSEIRYTGRT